MDRLAELGIDLWSIVIYMANTGVVLVVLIYFAYKPLLRIIDARRKQIADNIETANLLKEEFTKKLDESIQDKKKIEAELSLELDNLRKTVELKRGEMLKEIEHTRAEILKKAHEEISKSKARLVKDAEEDVSKLISRIILEIVQNKVPEKVVRESVEEAWGKYTKVYNNQ